MNAYIGQFIFPNDWYTKPYWRNLYWLCRYYDVLDMITVEDGPCKTFMNVHNLDKLPYEIKGE